MADKKKLAIDTEQFISQMRARPCLWDLADANYCKREHQRVAWLELADITRAPVHELKKRWRALRDRFARELRRLEAGGARSKAELEAACSYRYLKQLLFLRRAVHLACDFKMRRQRQASRRARSSRDTNGDCDPLASREALKQESSQNGSDGECDSSQNGSDGERDSSQRELQSPQREHASPDQENGFTEHEPPAPGPPEHEPPARRSPEHRRGPCACSCEADGDMQFLLSLAPFLRDVPRARKLLVRARLTQVLIDDQHQALR